MNCMTKAVIFTALIGQPAFAAELEVRVEGTRNDQGTITIMAFDSPGDFAQFDESKAVATVIMPVGPNAGVSLSGLPEGNYAIFAMHDEDRDGALGMDGAIPTEGYGYSGTLSPEAAPCFAETVINPASGPARITLRYW